MFQRDLCLACKHFIFLPISKLASIKELDNSVLLSKTAKILGKLKGHAPGEINFQSKQDLICHVAKVRFATSTHSMTDVIPFQLIYYSLRIESFQNTKRKYILPTMGNTIFVIRSVYACFKSFWAINISGCVIHGYLWYGRVEIWASRHEKKNKKIIDLKTALVETSPFFLPQHSQRSAHSNAVLDDSLITAHTISLIAPVVKSLMTYWS